MKRILVVEDEESVRTFLRLSLEANGFSVAEANLGKEGLEKTKTFKPDLIVLDYGLPDITGLEVLKQLRQWTEVPVIFLTARGAPEDKVAVLDAGADDYLTKPFSVPELLARIRMAFRHISADKEVVPVIRTGKLEIDLVSHVVRAGGKELKLSGTEYMLLKTLAKNIGKLVAHRQILKEVWGPNSVEHNHYLRVYFGMIRKKLDAASPGLSELLENESGVGYRLRSIL